MILFSLDNFLSVLTALSWALYQLSIVPHKDDQSISGATAASLKKRNLIGEAALKCLGKDYKPIFHLDIDRIGMMRIGTGFK